MGTIKIFTFWDEVFLHRAKRTGVYPDYWKQEQMKYGYKEITNIEDK